MARRVKKTDTREVDHWVSTDDGRHLPIDKDGNIIFSSSKKSTSKSGSNKTTSKSSSSEKSKSEAPAKKLTREQEVLNDEKIQNLLNTAKSSWGEGVFKDPDGEEFEIGYETDKYYNIYQTSDGQRFDESRVQRMVEGMDSGKYHAWNNQGQLLITSSARAAVKHAWGTPKEAGLKREEPEKSKSSTYKKNLNGTYQRQEMRDGTLVQATVIPGRDKGKDFYTIRTGIGDRFKSSDERYSTLSSAKKAADEMLEGRANLSNGKSQLPNIRSTKTRSYSRGEKVAASVGALGNNRKAARHLKSENRRSMLIEIAENAGVSSSKLQKMDTEDIRAMLLSMLGA